MVLFNYVFCKIWFLFCYCYFWYMIFKPCFKWSSGLTYIEFGAICACDSYIRLSFLIYLCLYWLVSKLLMRLFDVFIASFIFCFVSSLFNVFLRLLQYSTYTFSSFSLFCLSFSFCVYELFCLLLWVFYPFTLTICLIVWCSFL